MSRAGEESPPRRSLRRRAVLLAIVVAWLVPVTQCMRQDELECEEAVEHMSDCCPDFDKSSVHCTYSDTCGVTYPDLCDYERSGTASRRPDRSDESPLARPRVD